MSCSSRDGWSGGVFRASKLYQPCSASGPLGDLVAHRDEDVGRPGRRRPRAGAGRPAGSRSVGSVTSTASSTSTRASRCSVRTASRASCASVTARVAALSRLPGVGARLRRQRAQLAAGEHQRRAAAGDEPGPDVGEGVEVGGLGDRGQRRVLGGVDLFGLQVGHLNRVVGGVGCGHAEAVFLRETDREAVSGRAGRGVGALDGRRGARRAAASRGQAKGGAPAGRVNRNCAPPLGERSATMLPPWASTMPLTM